MKRRTFLQTSSMMTLPVFLRGMEVSAIQRTSLMDLIGPENDKVLVLVQLSGGNDGLNTLIPIDRVDNLMKARADIMLPQNKVLSISDTSAFHPNLKDFQRLYGDGNMTVVQGVAYPNFNRSHFRSTDIWTTAVDSNKYATTGWAGRYFDSNHPSYPKGFPSSEYTDPFAITMGSTVSETCQGQVANFSYTMSNVESLVQIPNSVSGVSDDSYYGVELDYMQNALKQSNAYADVVKVAYNKGANMVDYPATGNALALQLRNVARLISGGIKTKIFVVTLGGFDTHDNQVNGIDVLTGRHATLMTTLNQAIGLFQDDLKAQSLDRKVIGMTFSEFGRRIKANLSFGTDHGTAAPIFLFGSCVKGSVVGESPAIGPNVTNDEGVAMQYDFRSIYASILIDWFKVPKADIQEILFKDFQHLPIIEGCDVSTSTEHEELLIEATISPNPSSEYAQLSFESKGGRMNVSIFDSIGSLIRTVFDKDQPTGEHQVTIPVYELTAGHYFVRLAQGASQRSLKMLVTR